MFYFPIAFSAFSAHWGEGIGGIVQRVQRESNRVGFYSYL